MNYCKTFISSGKRFLPGIRVIFIGTLFVCMMSNCHRNIPSDFTPANKGVTIFPDYKNVTIPPNIAPLNFIIKENGSMYCVDIKAPESKLVRIFSKEGTISIKTKKWRNILKKNTGRDLSISVYVKNSNKKWKKYNSFSISIAPEPIDPYLAYRLIDPGFEQWSDLGIYQRNLTNFKEKAIFTNRATGTGTCMNCHSFCKRDPDKMLFHMRAAHGGTIIFNDNMLKKVNTKTKYTMSAGVYPSWHPDGNLIAFSVNKINQFFSLIPDETINVVDFHSDIIVYNIDKNMVTTCPAIATNKKENLPEWSPDGKYLYYCVADTTENIWQSKYELMRIPYDSKTNTWGTIDTVLGYSQFGASISFPKISPEGNYLIFSSAPYGYFTINYKESDLYLLNLETMAYKKMNINSNFTESYHSWSSNGRWIAFSSKRGDGLSARTYFSYFDSTGKGHKPFLLPQKVPSSYYVMYQSYNVPEFIKGKVKVPYHRLKKAAFSNAMPVEFDENVDVDALSGASKVE